MKQQILEKYSNLGERSHLHMSPQIKEYLSSPAETDQESGKEIVNLPFPGNTTRNFELRLKDEDMQPITISYMNFAATIQQIDLQFNRITDKGVPILATLLHFCENLTHLNLKGNQIGDSGCEKLSEKLVNKQKLSYLNLSTNIFGNLGLMSINVLLFKNPALTYLDVGCNRYDWDGIISITSAIKTSNETLKVLVMDDPGYKIFDQHFFAHFAEMLADQKEKKGGLQKLSLRSNQIRWEAVKIIFYKLQGNQNLNVLDLSGNQICFQGAIFLRDYLTENRIILRSLNLAHNKLKNNGAKILADGLSTNTNLVHLDITSNMIGDEGFEYFGTKMMENKGIKSLKLFWENEFGDNSIKVLGDLLEKKGKDFYPDFTIYKDYDPEEKNRKLCIAYYETHIPGEEELIIPK